MKQETIHEALRAAPPVGVGGLTIWGIQLSDGVLILTAIYTVFLLIEKAPIVIERFRSLWRKLKE